MNDHIQCLIINPNEIEREGMRRILNDGGCKVVRVAGQYSESFFDTVPADRRHICFVSSQLDENTLKVCAQVHDLRPDVLIIMLAHESESAMIARAFRSGVSGYVSSDTGCASLIAMIRLVDLGEKVIPSQVVFDLAMLDTGSHLADNDVGIEDANMSAREINILRGLIRGEPNKVISRQLNITEATVKVHVKSILRKLHVFNRTQAAIWAVSRGFTGEPDGVTKEDVPVVSPGGAKEEGPVMLTGVARITGVSEHTRPFLDAA